MNVPEESGGATSESSPRETKAPRAATLPRGAGVGWFGLAALVNAVGTGFFYPYQLLFFLAVTGFSLTTVGTGLTVATLLALPAVQWVGRCVDSWGTRRVLVAAALTRTVAFVAYPFVHNSVSFVVLAVLAAVAQRAEQVSVPVLAAGIAPEGEVGRWLALAKVAFNAGMGFGGLLAGLALIATGDRSGFVLVGLLNAASFALAALLYLPLPTVRPARKEAGGSNGSGGPWRDPLFLRIAVANFLLITVIVATEAGLPVYLVDHRRTPAWIVGFLFAVNTVIMVLFQLPISSRLRNRAPLRVIAAGSVLHAGLLGVLGFAGWLPLRALLPLLVLGMAVYTFGEIVSTQMLSVLLVTLAPRRQLGAYQAFNQVLVGLSLAIVPVLVAFFLTHAPAGLWWTLAATTAVICLGMLILHRGPAAAAAQRAAAG
ncbi:MFS transporter [Streptomyces sp. NPDC002588]|uniref:MFS transporter n=1 Tax=Streptomyces sp. NPDC002588 TaxID=3154419 RepID=UPI00331676A0